MKLKITFIVTLAILGRVIQSQAQTIPNAGFETWTSFGTYSDPTSWSSYNSITAGSGIFTTEQGTPGATGTSFLKLTVKNIPSFGGLFPGVAMSTPIYPTGMPGEPTGFPFSARPANFTGKWQYKSTGTDTILVATYFTRWNSATSTTDYIGGGYTYLGGGIVTTWTNFTIPISYMSGAIPDSATIMFMLGFRGIPVLNDYLYIDDIAYTGSVPAGIDEIQNQINMSIAPNPFSTITTISFSKEIKDANITLVNILGKEIKRFQFSGNSFELEKGDLPKGVYFLNIQNENNNFSKKIIIQ